MRKQITAMSTAVVLFGCASAMQAKTERIVGVIDGVERHSPPTVRLATRGAEARTIRTSEKTVYLKWVTRKPWEQNTLMDNSALVLGRCVEVELGADNVARVVVISDEPVGSVFDPCNGRR